MLTRNQGVNFNPYGGVSVWCGNTHFWMKTRRDGETLYQMYLDGATHEQLYEYALTVNTRED